MNGALQQRLKQFKLFILSHVKGLFFAALFLGLVAGAALEYHRHGPRFFGIHLNPPNRAFYYWRTVWNPSPSLASEIEKNEIKQLYMRFFDVDWNTSNARPQALSPLSFQAPLPKNVEIIPVIYITNRSVVKIEHDDVPRLADKIWKTVSHMAEVQKIQIHQLQLDCDWSNHSRKNYFYLADILRRKLNSEGIQISSTIRLHQIKYANITGIPPVNRGMLMFYNFGRVSSHFQNSTIFNEKDAKRYSSHIAAYKMPLDISLPIFSWILHTRDNRVIELIEKADPEEFLTVDGFERVSPNKIVAKKATLHLGVYFSQGDELVIDEINPEITQQAAKLAIDGSNWRKNYKTVAFFDMDERNLNRYGNNQIQKIFKQF